MQKPHAQERLPIRQYCTSVEKNVATYCHKRCWEIYQRHERDSFHGLRFLNRFLRQSKHHITVCQRDNISNLETVNFYLRMVKTILFLLEQLFLEHSSVPNRRDASGSAARSSTSEVNPGKLRNGPMSFRHPDSGV
jgi:hypothetical protein